MDIRKHRRAFTLTLFLLVSLAAHARAHAFQGNAVAGSVYSTDDKPLANVTVTLAQDKRVNGTSRRSDGLYMLQVPASMKRFDLLFEHPDYLKAIDQDIPNRNPPIERPQVVMTPKNLKHLSGLTERELDKIVAGSRAAMERGAQEELPTLYKAGSANLEDLLNAARAYRESARSIFERFSARAEAAERVLNEHKAAKTEGADGSKQAALLLKQAIAIQERVLGPNSVELASTLEIYAALLKEQGRGEAAKSVARRAETIRANSVPANETLIRPGP